MSFIDHKERVFCTKSELPRTTSDQNKSCNRLNFISSSTDPRAWSLDVCSQREYLLEAFQGNVQVKTSSSECSSSGSSYSSANSNTSLKVKKVKRNHRGLRSKYKSALSLVGHDETKLHELTDSLYKANARIKELISEKEEAERSAERTKEEAENLRKLIKDIREELSLTQSLKWENLKLRSELNTDLKNQFLEAQDEINYLSCQLEIFKNYQTEFSELQKAYNKLKEDNNSLNLSLVKFRSENEGLKGEMEEYKGKTCAEPYDWNAIVDRDVLRERIQMREEKINFLVSFLEEQQLTINDLAFQLDRISSTIAAKEEVMSKHMIALKSTLDEKNNRIIYLEDKLHSSELLIAELETLKQQLRLANAMLSENVLNYRAQFSAVVSCSEKLLVVRDNYEKELSERDAKIKKLSKFPQSPKTVVYLSQMLHILKKSEESASDDTDTIFSYVPSIRRIIDDMKSELWDQQSFNSVMNLNSTVTQTEQVLNDNYTQYEISLYLNNKCAEANLPDKFYFENQNLKNDLCEMRRSVEHLEKSYFSKDTLNKELERKLISSIDEKTLKERELEKTRKELELAEEKLLLLKEELEYNDSLLKKALDEIQIEQSVQESTSDLLSASLDSTLYEYTRHVDVLESYIGQNEKKIESLENYINQQIQTTSKFQDEYTCKLEAEVKRLTETNLNEKQTIDELNKQISLLNKQLADKKNKFKLIQGKLEKAERLFEQINKLDYSDSPKEKCDLGNFGETEVEQIVVQTSNKILLYGKKLEDYWKEETNFKEKLLRETFSQNYVEILLKSNRLNAKKLKLKLKQLKGDIGRKKNMLNKARKSIKYSKTKINNYKLLIKELKRNFEKLLEENKSINLQLSDKIKEIEDLNMDLVAKEMNHETLKFEKDKMEKVLLKIIGNLQQTMSGQGKESIGTLTEIVRSHEELRIKKLTSKNIELSTVIEELQERLDSLLYVPQKETQTELLSVSVQAEMGLEKQREEQMEKQYKIIIQKLEDDLEKEKQVSEKIKTNQIESHRNELKLIMKTVRKNILNIKNCHDEELARMNALHQEKIKQLVKKDEIEQIHRNELEKQKKNYESMLSSKDEELNKGINELRVEIRNIISQKEESIRRIKEVTNIHINYLKKKYKKSIKKIKHELRVTGKKYNELREMTNKAQETKRDIDSQTEISDIKSEKYTKYDKDSQTSLENGRFSCFTQCYITEPNKHAQCQTKPVEIRDAEANTNEYTFTREKGNDEIPEKGDHVIFTLPTNKKFDINYRESIKCSIKETKSTYIGEIFKEIPALIGSGDAPVRDISYSKRRKSELITHIEQLEDELFQKSEDFNRIVVAYQEAIRKQNYKIKELEKSMNEESLQIYQLQHRLGMEFTRAEQLLAQKGQLEEYVEALEKHIQDHEIESHSEREKYNHLKKRFDSVIYQRKQTDQLEETLKRLKEKLETAVAYEKKLTEEVNEEKIENQRIQNIMEYNNSLQGNESNNDFAKKDKINIFKEEEKDNVRNVSKSDLKVIFIQQCQVRRMWSRQILHGMHQNISDNIP